MFDNLSKEENKSSSLSQNTEGDKKIIPPNDSVDKESTASLPKKEARDIMPKADPGQVEDIFSSVDSEDKPSPFKAVTPLNSKDKNVDTNSGIPKRIPPQELVPKGGSKKFVIVGIVVAMAIIIFVALLFINSVVDRSKGSIDEETEITEIAEKVVEEDAPGEDEIAEGEVEEEETIEEEREEEETEEVVFEPIKDNKIFDKDNDGLKDDEEIEIGTDVNSPDTDGDGLFDREEVKVYKTNPLERDTDQDGYNDKEEVLAGYNPLGEGKLKDFPDASFSPEDSDNDGLTDQEENELGTNINNKDSDGDGLSDEEEVKMYKTDPLDMDTDNDSYNDGEEIKNGYNPLGEGKI